MSLRDLMDKPMTPRPQLEPVPCCYCSAMFVPKTHAGRTRRTYCYSPACERWHEFVQRSTKPKRGARKNQEGDAHAAAEEHSADPDGGGVLQDEQHQQADEDVPR